MPSTNLPPCCVPSPEFDPAEFAYTRFCLAADPPGINLHGREFPTWADLKGADDPYDQEFVKQFSAAISSVMQAVREGFLDAPAAYRAACMFELLYDPSKSPESFDATR
jgi:hypothetical protein